MIIFETKRLVIRRYKADDFSDFFRLNSDKDVMRYIRPVQTRKQAASFFIKILEAYDKAPGLGRWGMYIKPGNEFAGSFAIIPVQQSEDIQLGYAFLKEHWGSGYASESVKGGIAYAFDQLQLTQIAGITFPENLLSQKVLLKNRFVFHKTITEEDKEINFYLLHRDS
jgi:[ribosomal protein S5]-alanine N-acetyltransferase